MRPCTARYRKNQLLIINQSLMISKIILKAAGVVWRLQGEDRRVCSCWFTNNQRIYYFVSEIHTERQTQHVSEQSKTNSDGYRLQIQTNTLKEVRKSHTGKHWHSTCHCTCEHTQMFYGMKFKMTTEIWSGNPDFMGWNWSWIWNICDWVWDVEWMK